MARRKSLYLLANSLVEEHQLATKLAQANNLQQAMDIVAKVVKDFLIQALSYSKDEYQDNPAHHYLIEQLSKKYQDLPPLFSGDDENYLAKAMSYSLLSSGKMVRPTIVFACGLIGGAPLTNLLLAGAALECIHCYSLIHDDLPAMDDDDFRRGLPANHKVHGEAHAILAGDALQSLAFTLLAANEELDASIPLAQVKALALASGHYGMCYGQSLDLLSEGQKMEKMEGELRLQLINLHKTCCLFACGADLGALAWQEKNPLCHTELTKCLYNFGLMFQIKDDILDIEGDQDEIGKPLGSDLAKDKMTYVSLFGMDYCKNKISQDGANEKARLELIAKQYPEKEFAISWLKELLDFAINRKK